MTSSEVESSYNTTTSNNKYFNSASALQIRLETTHLIENIELFLRGAKIVIQQDEKGRIQSRQVNMGMAKANAKGIQSILNHVQLVLNPQVVQGNFYVDGSGHSSMYEDYVYWARIELTKALVQNCYAWEVNEDDVDLIVDSIMAAVEPFMTRLIGNKERESYAETIRHNESNTLREGNKNFMDNLKVWGGNQK